MNPQIMNDKDKCSSEVRADEGQREQETKWTDDSIKSLYLLCVITL